MSAPKKRSLEELGSILEAIRANIRDRQAELADHVTAKTAHEIQRACESLSAASAGIQDAEDCLLRVHLVAVSALEDDSKFEDESEGVLKHSEAMRAALHAFVGTVDATGGVTHNRKGEFAPVADPDWLDLADAYDKACAALGREMLVVGREPLTAEERVEIIEKLTEDLAEAASNCIENAQGVMRDGFKGLMNFTDEELLQEYAERFDEEFPR